MKAPDTEKNILLALYRKAITINDFYMLGIGPIVTLVYSEDGYLYHDKARKIVKDNTGAVERIKSAQIEGCYFVQVKDQDDIDLTIQIMSIEADTNSPSKIEEK